MKLPFAAALSLSLVTLPVAAAEVDWEARKDIVLSQVERDFLLTEMHSNMTALQTAFDAVAKGDWDRAAAAATTRGMSTFGDKDPTRPKTLTAKLPPEWKLMAGAGRRGFDDLAAALTAKKERTEIDARLAALFDNCNACHAVYRFKVE